MTAKLHSGQLELLVQGNFFKEMKGEAPMPQSALENRCEQASTEEKKTEYIDINNKRKKKSLQRKIKCNVN